jgi:enediyne biosynthesis protein E4
MMSTCGPKMPAPTGPRALALCACYVAATVIGGCSQGDPVTQGGGASEASPLRPQERAHSQRPGDDSSIGLSAAPPVRSLARFVDRTPGSGLEFTYVNGEEAGHHAILESLGGGGGLFDFDRDGLLDVMLAGGGGFDPEHRVYGAETGLFRNLGEWKFDSVQHPARVAEAPFYSHGICAGDFDNDGFTDVLITGYGGLRLHHNCGDGTFVEVSVPAGLIDSSWSSSAAWGDIDGDGNLDLYVAHYVNWSFDNHPECMAGELREVCPPRQFDPLPDLFYRSNGDGTFTDATAEIGLEPDGKGLGVVIADIDLDGAADIYVSNDTVPNFLYLNDGAGGLVNRSLFSGTALSDDGVPEGSMGVDVGDYNNDGQPDIWIANYENESFGLYSNRGRGFFQHVSRPTGVTAMGGLFVGWGTAFIDYDRDGDQDLIATNGHVVRHPINAPVLQRAIVLENIDGRRFVNVVDQAGEGYLQQSHMGRGLATGDFDRDGRVDLLITHTNAPAVVLANESRDEHNWLGLRLVGTLSNRDAIGASIHIESSTGARQLEQVKGGGSYASTSELVRRFGLRNAEAVRRVEIRWPSGTIQVLEDPEINQELTLIEPAPSAP